MNWFECISDFIYQSFEWLGPFVFGPVIVIWVCLYLIADAISAPIMRALKISSKYQGYFKSVLFCAIFLALIIIISISLSKHPNLDWMEDDF